MTKYDIGTQWFRVFETLREHKFSDDCIGKVSCPHCANSTIHFSLRDDAMLLWCGTCRHAASVGMLKRIPDIQAKHMGTEAIPDDLMFDGFIN